MQTQSRPALWCTTCGVYIRAGTHGMHAMSLTSGAAEPARRTREAGDAAPMSEDEWQFESLSRGALILLAMVWSGIVLGIGAALVFGPR